jgi:hypothetical protein
MRLNISATDAEGLAYLLLLVEHLLFSALLKTEPETRTARWLRVLNIDVTLVSVSLFAFALYNHFCPA